MTRFYQFGPSPAEVSCALLLSRSRSVLASVRSGSKSAFLLRAAGFRPLASEWHCVRDLSTDPCSHDRKSRVALSKSLSAWRSHGLSLELTTVGAIGLPRLEEEFYYPILVRDLYSKGHAPHGAQNLDRFRALAKPQSVVALVRKGTRVCGAGLLKSEDLTRLDLLVAGVRRPALARCLAGDVYCLEEGLADCRRAFLYALAIAAAQGGWSALSYGADMAWVDRGYVPIILEKLRWADAVLASVGLTQPHFHGGPGISDTDATGLALVIKAGIPQFERYAAEAAQVRTLATRLARINRERT